MSRDFGDPIAMLIGPGATELDIAHLRRLFGLRAGLSKRIEFVMLNRRRHTLAKVIAPMRAIWRSTTDENSSH